MSNECPSAVYNRKYIATLLLVLATIYWYVYTKHLLSVMIAINYKYIFIHAYLLSLRHVSKSKCRQYMKKFVELSNIKHS